MFLCVRWDFSRKLPSWGLKPIIEFLELSKEGRVFYDASQIRHNFKLLKNQRGILCQNFQKRRSRI